MASSNNLEIPIRLKPEPFCPECGGRMKLRRPFPGQNWRPFWGCISFPDCRGKKQIQDNGLPEEDDGYDS